MVKIISTFLFIEEKIVSNYQFTNFFKYCEFDYEKSAHCLKHSRRDCHVLGKQEEDPDPKSIISDQDLYCQIISYPSGSVAEP